MLVPTVSEFGTKTTQIFYNNGTSSPPEHTLVRKSTTSGSAGPILKGDHKSPKAWNFQVNTVKGLSGTVRYKNPSHTTVESGQLSNSPGLTYPVVNSDEIKARAYSSCLDSFYQQLSGVADIASSVAEGGVGRSAQQVVQAADDVRRQAGSYGVKTFGKAWLHAQYVWKPLCSDIYAVVQAASGTMTRKGIRVKAQSTQTGSADAQTLSYGGYSFGKVPSRGVISHRIKMEASFVVNPSFDLLAQLTSLDPAVIAWNMLPYSFVVDWFYNVGGYLGQLESAALYKSAFRTQRSYVTYSEKTELAISHYGSAIGYPTINGQFSSTFVRKGMNRVPLGSIPLPLPPSLKVDLGSGTMLNAAALLASKLKF